MRRMDVISMAIVWAGVLRRIPTVRIHPGREERQACVSCDMVVLCRDIPTGMTKMGNSTSCYVMLQVRL